MAPYTSHTQSDQASSPVQPRVSLCRIPELSFHKVIYSGCSNTEVAPTGASKKGPQAKEPLGFYPPTVQEQKGLTLPPESSAPATSLSPLAQTQLPEPFVMQSVGSSQPLDQAPTRAQPAAPTAAAPRATALNVFLKTFTAIRRLLTLFLRTGQGAVQYSPPKHPHHLHSFCIFFFEVHWF